MFDAVTQRETFDRDEADVRRWIAEGQPRPPETALSYFEAVPRSWGMAAGDGYQEPVVGVKEGRERALKAYEGRGY